MFFDVQVLARKRKIRFDEVFPPGNVDFPDLGVRQVGPLRAWGEAELLDALGAREIRLRGKMEGEVEICCARCLEPTRLPISASLDLFYRPMTTLAAGAEVAISTDETEVGFYESGGLELAEIVREQVMIQLPMRAICVEDCRGICPLCGKNRNREACRCQETLSDTRWEALRNWKN